MLSGRGLCDGLITRPPSVVRQCVVFRNLRNEKVMVRIGPQRHRERGEKKKPEENTENFIVFINLNYSIT